MTDARILLHRGNSLLIQLVSRVSCACERSLQHLVVGSHRSCAADSCTFVVSGLSASCGMSGSALVWQALLLSLLRSLPPPLLFLFLFCLLIYFSFSCSVICPVLFFLMSHSLTLALRSLAAWPVSSFCPLVLQSCVRVCSYVVFCQ